VATDQNAISIVGHSGEKARQFTLQCNGCRLHLICPNINAANESAQLPKSGRAGNAVVATAPKGKDGAVTAIHFPCQPEQITLFDVTLSILKQRSDGLRPVGRGTNGITDSTGFLRSIRGRDISPNY
jgi:hypothetical protein